MSIRSTNTTRNLDTRKSSVPTIGKGIPLDRQGGEGDLTFRVTPSGLKLYIKANSKWHGVKVGESFNFLEKRISEINSRIDNMKTSQPSPTYSVRGNITLDSSGDIELNADGGQVTIKDDTASHFLFNCDTTALTIYDDADSGDLFQISVTTHGATTVSTTDDDASAADLSFRPDGDLYLRPTNGTTFTNSVVVDSDKTQTTAHSVPSFLIDNDYTGIIASGQICNNYAAKIESNQESPTMVGAVNHYGIHSTVTSGTTGTQKAYGIYNMVTGGDEVVGYYSRVDNGSPDLKLVDFADANDYFSISTGANGATTIATVDDNAAAANLTLDVDGSIYLNADAGGIYFEDASERFANFQSGILNIFSAADVNDYFRIAVTTNGETTLNTVDDSASAAHLNIEPQGHVEFDGCGVGFDLVTPSYDSSTTAVDFRTGNKQFVTFAGGNITNITLTFPATSGNFTLLLKQDLTGGRTITNWKAMESDGSSADGAAAVKFPGGTNPTLTTDAQHVDIISFFWDADNEIAYGVATLDFQN